MPDFNLMKTHLIASLLLLSTSLLCAQSYIIPLAKKRSDETLISGFKLGAKTMTFSAAGTVVWEDGATFTGASYFRTAAGLGNVENTALSTWAGSANLTTLGTISTGTWHGTAIGDTYISSAATWNGKESVLTFSAPLARSTNTISLGTTGPGVGAYGSSTQVPRITLDAYGRVSAVAAQTITPAENVVTFTDITTNNASTTKHGYLPKLDGTSTHYLDGSGAWSTPPSGLTVGTTAISGSSSGDILTSDGSHVTKLTPGTGVSTALGNAVNATGGLLTYGMIGTSGTKLPLLNTANTFSAAQVVDVASGSFLTCKLAGTDFTYIKDDGLYLGMPGVSGYQARIFSNWGGLMLTSNFISANYGLHFRATGGSAEIEYFNLWDTGSANQMDLRNGTTAQVLRVSNTWTSSTNWEAFDIDWQTEANVCHLKPKAGSGGGTVRAVRYWFSATVWMGSGSGSPEGVEIAGIGSIYTDTSTGDLYRKTSGTGNTGWVTP